MPNLKLKKYYTTVLPIVLGAAALFIACEKDEPDPIKPANKCEQEQTNYDAAKVTASADSTSFVNWKSGAPKQVISAVNTRINSGMSESEAWEAAINNFIINENAPAELKAWAQGYAELLSKFNNSKQNRQNAGISLNTCKSL